MFWTLLTGLGSGIVGAVKGFFGWKTEQAQVVKSAIETLSAVQSTDGEVATAAATVLSQIMTQGSFLEKNWRPLLMLLIILIIGSFWFGYVPKDFYKPLPPMMERIFGMLEIGLMGYLPLRSVDKWIQSLQISKIIQMLIAKRLL